MKKVFFITLPFLILFLGLLTYLFFTYPTASPFVSLSYMIDSFTHSHKRLAKQTIGVLPYWRIDDSKYIRFPDLSEVNYFSLSVTQNGEIVTVVNNETNPGWRWWNSDAIKNLIANTQIHGDKFTFTISAQQNEIIEGILNSSSAQQTLTDAIITQMKSKHLNGVSIDFEYNGKPDEKYRNAFTFFMKNLASQLKEQTPEVTLTLNLLPLSGRDKGLFDLDALNHYVDRFIGMSYDYYASSSDIAGPVAPLQGFAEGKYFFDVTTTYADYLKFLPKEKIIMGIPYYGWDWPVTNAVKQSPTLPQNDKNGYPEILSYARMKTDPDIQRATCAWDDLAAETWCSYENLQTGSMRQTWFEDEKSLAAKYLFVKERNLSGIAIWTLGYDKERPELWRLLENNFGLNN